MCHAIDIKGRNPLVKSVDQLKSSEMLLIILFIAVSAIGTSVQANNGPGIGGDHRRDRCMRKCPKLLDPVCAHPVGSNDKPETFSNECELHNHNCESKQKYKFSHKGECNRRCNRVCTADFRPVCAVPVGPRPGEPREFSNKCMFEVHNCRNPKQRKFFGIFTQISDW
ncbi:Vasotab [Pseudolycoriella hygida]|uniref:Vasotab n=1 Tax=Pseudolycoriella hygida TaxID=35572 RepID=A0A9Q0S1C0_9DIPT|nr:Vasotab [Pseudolycoriella hygida]